MTTNIYYDGSILDEEWMEKFTIPIEHTDSPKITMQCPRKGERKGLKSQIRKLCKRFLPTPTVQLYRKPATSKAKEVENTSSKLSDEYDGYLNEAVAAVCQVRPGIDRAGLKSAVEQAWLDKMAKEAQRRRERQLRLAL